MMTQYTTYGYVRGCSGIRHDTREDAEAAVERDQIACARQRGHSDRIVAVIGADQRLYHDEACAQPVWSQGCRTNGAARFRAGR